MQPPEVQGDGKWRSVFTPGSRRLLNSFPMLMNVLVPWFFFLITFWLYSFRFHFTRGAWLPLVGGFLAFCCALPFIIGEYQRLPNNGPAERRPLYPGGPAADLEEPQALFGRSYGYSDPTWWRSSCLLMTIAVGSASFLGDYNYHKNMLPYYSYSALESYPQVDVGHELGVNLLDAGRVYFSSTAQILQEKSWHFKDGTLYCVAPIASTNGMAKDTYDFWAVGTNCCSEVAADFRCGEFSNARARAGLRLMDSATLPFYRLAVNQATAQFGVHATTPLFFTWTQDPLNDIQQLLDAGFALFQFSALASLAFLVFAVVLLSFRFAMIGRSKDPVGEGHQRV